MGARLATIASMRMRHVCWVPDHPGLDFTIGFPRRTAGASSRTVNGAQRFRSQASLAVGPFSRWRGKVARDSVTEGGGPTLGVCGRPLPKLPLVPSPP